MTLTCGGPNATCPMCTGTMCLACRREPMPAGELRICQHDSIERHMAIPALSEDEPVQNRTPTKPIPPLAKQPRARIEMDFANADIGTAADFFEHIASTIRRRGKLVLVEPEE